MKLVLNDIDLAQTGVRNRRRCIVLRSGGPVGPLCVRGGEAMSFLGTPGLLQLTG